MTIQQFSSALEELDKTAARNEITVILSKVFHEASVDEISPLCYLSLGRLAPKYEGIEFQLAEKMMVRVLALTYQEDEKKITELFKKSGDLGDTAYTLASSKLNPPAGGQSSKQIQSPNIKYIYAKLLEIALEEGQGSQERKVKGFSDLLKQLDPLSAKYVVRMPIGALRLGFSDMTILDSLSFMETGDKSLRKTLERAFNVSVDIGRIARVFKERGIEGIKKLKPHAGIPIRPQQSERLPAAADILEKLGPCAIEYKLDGLRAQVHILSKIQRSKDPKIRIKKQLQLGETEEQKEVRIFSRNLENTTHMFPEIVKAAQDLPVDSAVLDGEAIGYNPKTGKMLPFQETSQRKRKHGIEEIAKTIPIKYFAFDLLYLNGEDLLQRPFRERRELLANVLKVNSK